MSYDYSENILVQEAAGNLMRDERGRDEVQEKQLEKQSRSCDAVTRERRNRGGGYGRIDIFI